MRSPIPAIACMMAFVCVGGCTPDDPPNLAVSLPPPYSQLPSAPAGTPIEAGTRMTLDARQQEAVVNGVTRWLKNPGSAQFGTMAGALDGRGTIVVCGRVTGRNSAGAYVGMTPYIGVLMGGRASPDFVVVGIGGSTRERAEVASLCRESGVPDLG